MTTKYVQDGNTIDYSNTGAAIASGDPVVIKDTKTGMLCVARDDIAATTGTGVLNTTGVHILPKVSAAVIAQGGAVYWDASAAKVDDDAATPATGDFLCGTAWEAAGNGVTTIRVKLTGVATALTA